jgi:hypothetical protein
MTRNATLLHLAFHTISCGALLANMYTASFAGYAMSRAFGQNCFHPLRNLVPLWSKLHCYAPDDRFCKLLTSCAFMAKPALLATRCLAMSRAMSCNVCDVSQSLFSLLLYWWWKCPVPVEPDSHLKATKLLHSLTWHCNSYLFLTLRCVNGVSNSTLCTRMMFVPLPIFEQTCPYAKELLFHYLDDFVSPSGWTHAGFRRFFVKPSTCACTVFLRWGLCLRCVFATRPTFTLCFRDYKLHYPLAEHILVSGDSLWRLHLCLCCVFAPMKDPTNFVSLSGQTHSGLQQFFKKPSSIFMLCFGNKDHPFSRVDWKWYVRWHALHTIHQLPREFLRRTVSSSCNLARVESTLQCKDDQRPHPFHCYLVVCGELNKFSGPLAYYSQPSYFCIWLHIMPYTCTLCIGQLFKNNCKVWFSTLLVFAELCMDYWQSLLLHQAKWDNLHMQLVSSRYLPFGLLSCFVALQRPCNTTMSPFGLLSCCVTLQQQCDTTVLAALSIGGSQFHASTATRYMHCIAKEVCLQGLCSYLPFKDCTNEWRAALTTKDLEVGQQ